MENRLTDAVVNKWITAVRPFVTSDSLFQWLEEHVAAYCDISPLMYKLSMFNFIILFFTNY